MSTVTSTVPLVALVACVATSGGIGRGRRGRSGARRASERSDAILVASRGPGGLELGASGAQVGVDAGEDVLAPVGVDGVCVLDGDAVAVGDHVLQQVDDALEMALGDKTVVGGRDGAGAGDGLDCVEHCLVV